LRSRPRHLHAPDGRHQPSGVPSAQIVASDPGDDAQMFDPAADKVYRHPTFYNIPDDVKHI
jgi:phenylacetate-CoA oxygenase PaaH subunit